MPGFIALLLLLVPVLGGQVFSSLDLGKWGVLMVAAALFVAIRSSRQPRTSPPRFAVAAALVWAAVFLASNVGAYMDGAVFPAIAPLREGAHQGAALLILWLLLGRRATPRGQDLMAGAALMAPMLVLVHQWLLERGIAPLGTPFRGELTAGIGNTALVGQLGVLSLPFAFLILRRVSPPRVLFTLWGVVPAIYLILRSDARSAWIGLAVLVTAALVAMGRRRGARSVRWVVLGLGLLTLLLVGGGVAGRVWAESPRWCRRIASVVDPDHPTNRVRIELAKDAATLLRGSPVVGLGGGRFPDGDYRVRRPVEWGISGIHSIPSDPHNELLRLLVESGGLGLAAFLVLLLLAATTLRRKGRSPDAEERNAAMAGWAMLAAAAPLALTWGIGLHATNLLPMAVLFGLVLRTRNDVEASDTSLRVAKGSVALATVLALVWPPLELERDQAAVQARAEMENLKAELVTLPVADPGRVDLLARLGDAAHRALQIADSPLLTPMMSHRLQRALLNLSQEVKTWELALRAGGANATPEGPLLNVLRAFPQLDDLRESLASVLRRHPTNIPTLRLAAELERVAGRTPECIDALRRALDVNPAAPLVRPMLALLEIEAGLEDRAIANLERETELYPAAPETDLSWELLARRRGGEGRLDEAVEVVRRWIAARGESERRRALWGEFTLFWGETPGTLGRFRQDLEELERAAEEGAFEAASHEGLAPRVRKMKLLARLSRAPWDTASLEALRTVMESLQANARGQQAPRNDALRNRVIARYRVLFAWEAHLRDQPRMLRIHLRDARRMNPGSGDPWLVETIHALEQDREDRALELLRRWKEVSPKTFPGIELLPGLAPLLGRPEARALLDS